MIAEDLVRGQLDNCLSEARFERWASQYHRAKVRDMYTVPGRRILITTDRQSAFDHVLGTIPFKGSILNLLAQYWFEQTADIVPNHVEAVPDPNVTVAKELKILPVEIVVRAYMTGSSDTSIWTHYQRGVRSYCGIDLPEGMVKNQPFAAPIITPTTKNDAHDELISRGEIIAGGLVDEATWAEVERIALALFERGTQLAARQGLILVDTKYEMGFDENGRITLADEVHTPDSSRYWVKDTYDERHARGDEPENLDKEFLRLWLREKGISDDHIPRLDEEIRVEVARRYIDIYERVTGRTFAIDPSSEPVTARIERAIAPYLT
jgi:phosphoribosylaminoimidazole-succinocarboxamide synthase